jgi:4-amino-4-deoxy-L-arabinose transferase-like glycosyltransferase
MTSDVRRSLASMRIPGTWVDFMSHAALVAIVLVYLHNTLPYLTMLPRINVDEPWLLERAYQLATTGAPSQPMFLLDQGYLLQPGYALLFAPWIEVFGLGLREARVLTVLCGLGTVGAVYWLGRQLFGSAAGAVAAMFLATDSNFLGIARMARTDAPATFFVALGLALSLRGLKTARVSYAVAGGLSTAVAMLCHANSYWVGVVVFLWYLVSFGWRLVLTPSAYGYVTGLALGFGPYVVLVLQNFAEFRGQLEKFAIERVPGYSPSVIWYHITQESSRYRDWYFGLITYELTNPLLVLFKWCTVAGAIVIVWRVWRDRGQSASVRSETLAAVLAFGAAVIFGAFIPNKALVYLPNLLIGFAVVSGFFVVWLFDRVVPPSAVAAIRIRPLVACAVMAHGLTAVAFYQYWYLLMSGSDLRPYEETHAIVESLVPPGPKYLVASPTFWLPFHDDVDVKFISYTGAGPYETVDISEGYARRRSLFELPQDRPTYLLIDETEWRAVLDDPAYNAEWRETWLTYLRTACSLDRVAFQSAHGILALYRCWPDRRARPLRVEYLHAGGWLRDGRLAWHADARAMANWERYTSTTELSVDADRVHVQASGAGGIVADIPVEAGATYLLKPAVTAVAPGHVLAIAEMADGRVARRRGSRLAAEGWFPAGAIVQPGSDTLRVHLYADTGTQFSVRSVDLIALIAEQRTTGR